MEFQRKLIAGTLKIAPKRWDFLQPTKNMVIYQIKSGGRTLLHVKDELAHGLTGQNSPRMQFDDKITSYMVEECTLEKVTPEEMTAYQGQIKLFRNNAGTTGSLPAD